MNQSVIDFIVENMATNNEMADIQKVQTEHRLRLAEFWNIQKGDRILEIGCGQGDTTAVLAYLVGEEGEVHGVDIGAPTYGSPITVGDSAKYLMSSRLGKQIKMDFEIDILSSQVHFPDQSFDYVVLSHCSWYLKSSEEFKAVLEKVRKWGKRLCFAEWNPIIQSIEQYPHLLAILIQAQYEAFKQNSESNVRSLFTPEDIKVAAAETGWKIVSEKSILSPQLQDGKWEVAQVLAEYDRALKENNHIPRKLDLLIRSEVSMLKEAIKIHDQKPLSTYAFIAE
jgi:SAM-dependent methyltransferase